MKQYDPDVILGWVRAVALAAIVAAWVWQHERWHDLNKRTAELAAKAEAYSEMCRAIKGPRT